MIGWRAGCRRSDTRAGGSTRENLLSPSCPTRSCPSNRPPRGTRPSWKNSRRFITSSSEKSAVPMSSMNSIGQRNSSGSVERDDDVVRLAVGVHFDVHRRQLHQADGEVVVGARIVGVPAAAARLAIATADRSRGNRGTSRRSRPPWPTSADSRRNRARGRRPRFAARTRRSQWRALRPPSPRRLRSAV